MKRIAAIIALATVAAMGPLALAPSADAAMVGCTVYATREGLVGHTTANGHVIQERDHFVALPSARPLASDGGHEYQVTLRNPATGQWATEPVYDVGPWNTKDDYWAPSNVREMWSDLPQCKPEAEAAYYDGYNGGKDEFGRTVLNPAGIDLADGTFWDSLGMSDNGWVDAYYRWTESEVTVYRVTASALNVRTGPGAGHADVGNLPYGYHLASFDASGSWESFWFDDDPAWSHGGYMVVDEGGRYLQVNVAALNVRSGPSTGYSILGQVQWPGKYVLTHDAVNDGCGTSAEPWCKIFWNGQEAWVYAHAYTTLQWY